MEQEQRKLSGLHYYRQVKRNTRENIRLILDYIPVKLGEEDLDLDQIISSLFSDNERVQNFLSQEEKISEYTHDNKKTKEILEVLSQDNRIDYFLSKNRVYFHNLHSTKKPDLRREYSKKAKNYGCMAEKIEIAELNLYSHPEEFNHQKSLFDKN